MTDIQKIPFHEDELYAIVDEQTGVEYVLPKRFCEIFRLSWAGQHAKLTKSPLFSKRIKKILIQLPGDTQSREVLLLERGMVDAWLMSISVERVALDLKSKLLQYQNECAKVLHDYFTKGVVLNPRSATEQFPELRAIVELVEATAQARLIAEAAKLEAQEAKIEAAQANAKADMAMETQTFFTVAEYVTFNKLQPQVPPSAYKACSDYLRLYCLDHNIPFRKVQVGGKSWTDEYAYHVSLFVELLPEWVTRRFAQAPLTLVTRTKETPHA